MIALLLGAGFSAPFGVPTMRPFLDDFVALARRRYPDLIDLLAQLLERVGKDADLEGLLSQLGRAADVQGVLPAELDSTAIEQWSRDAHSLRAHLLAFIVERCEQFDRERTVELIGPLLRGIDELKGALLSTNYDRVIEYVCEDAGIALSDGFERRAGLLVAPWNGDLASGLSLAKLHGSVTWYRDAAGTALRLDRGYPLPDADFALSRGGQPLDPLMIVPTLEKQILEDPYMHLLGFLQDVLRRSRLLVVVGNSLRDEHLNGAIRYRGAELTVLIVGRTPQKAATRLGHTTVVTLQADVEPFLRVCTRDLISFLASVKNRESSEVLTAAVHEWAAAQEQAVAEWVGLTSEQHVALERLADREGSALFDAIRVLRGVRHPRVLGQLRRLLNDPNGDVRSAAAGALGLARAAEAVTDLSERSRLDALPVVRLEASLALQMIGTPDAARELERREREHPEDEFISGLLKRAAAPSQP